MEEKLADLLNQYFEIGTDNCYAYNLTRCKSAFGVGTVGLDDFEEFDEENSADIAKYLAEHGVLVAPCKAGDVINQFKLINGDIEIISAKVTSVKYTSKTGFTINAPSWFYPIKADEYDFAPVSQYPYALADFYIGSHEEAKKVLSIYLESKEGNVN